MRPVIGIPLRRLTIIVDVQKAKPGLFCLLFQCCRYGTLRFHDNTKEWTLELRRSPQKKYENELRTRWTEYSEPFTPKPERKTTATTDAPQRWRFQSWLLHRRDGIGQMNGSKTILLLFIGWMTLDRWTVPKPSSTKTTTFAQIHRFHEHADNPISKNANPFYHCISEAELVRCSLEAVIKFRQAVLHKTSASQPNALSSSMHNAAGQIHRFQSNHRSHMVVPHWQTRRCNKC